MKAGPKGTITAPPLNLDHLPPSGRVIAFVEGYLRVPKGTGARKPVRLRDWQRKIIHGLFDNPRPRSGLLSVPRGNGKTALAAFLAAYALYADEAESPQVLCVASDERQAGIVFTQVRRMVELEPRLAEQTHIYERRLVVPRTNGELRPLPAEPAALQGYDPTLCVVDELHVVPEDVWESMTLAAGKRDRSLTLAISTPAGDTDGVMWKLREHALDQVDNSFFFAEFGAPAGCALDDEVAWHEANPALGDFLHIDALRANRRTSRESSFRRYRLGSGCRTTTHGSRRRCGRPAPTHRRCPTAPTSCWLWTARSSRTPLRCWLPRSARCRTWMLPGCGSQPGQRTR